MFAVIFLGFSLLVLALGALGLTVWGLIQKKKTLWVSALVAFGVVGVLAGTLTVLLVKKSVDYLDSDEFGADTRATATAVGAAAGRTVSGAAQGLGAGLDDAALEKLARKGGTLVGRGVKAAAAGLDETAGKTTVFADESLAAAGIGLGRAQELPDSARYRFGLFLDFRQDFNGTLLLTAYDSKGLKMDNAAVAVEAKAGAAKVYVFAFQYFQPGLSGYCVLSKAK